MKSKPKELSNLFLKVGEESKKIRFLGERKVFLCKWNNHLKKMFYLPDETYMRENQKYDRRYVSCVYILKDKSFYIFSYPYNLDNRIRELSRQNDGDYTDFYFNINKILTNNKYYKYNVEVDSKIELLDNFKISESFKKSNAKKHFENFFKKENLLNFLNQDVDLYIPKDENEFFKILKQMFDSIDEIKIIKDDDLFWIAHDKIKNKLDQVLSSNLFS